MSTDLIRYSQLQQDAIRAKCIHPHGRGTEFPRETLDESVVARFEQMVDLHPQRLAVKHGTGELNYLELDRRVNQLAQALLQRRGPHAEPVALLLSQGSGALVAMLAVLKAGKFYVVLDQEQPAARLSATLQDADAKVLICDHVLRSQYPELIRQMNCVIEVEDVSLFSAARPGLSLGPQTQAFITYTSGSTAQPKGVLYHHVNVSHQVFLQNNTAHICPEDRIALARPYGSNGAVKDIYCALLNGASVFPLNPRYDGLTRIVEQFRAERITIWYTVASTFRGFCRALAVSDSLPDLRFVLLGGERMRADDIELFQRHFARDAVLMLNYGITETAGTVCGWLVDHDGLGQESTVPAGFPIDGTIVKILDDAGRVAPTGAAGEIVVTSRHLAQGYWKRSDLTAQAFAVDPSSPDWRVYRTGDLGVLDVGGCLTHLGRKDSFVKIRGHLVDPGDVERALLATALVRDAAVIARPDHRGETSLTAYVVSRVQPAPTVSAMRNELAKTLTDYMLPASFVVLDSLPLTPGGKLDRRALPAPNDTRPELDAVYVGPRDPVERQLASIWCEILDIKTVGIHDNFFDLGGHSLMAAELFDRISKVTGRNLPPAILFECPTIEQLACAMREQNWSPAWTSLVPMQPRGSKPPLFLIPPSGGSVFRFAELAGQLGGGQPVYGLEPLGNDDRHQPMDRVEDMASAYLREIRELQPTGPYLLAGICFGSFVAWEMARQLSQRGAQVDLVAIVDSGAPESGPTWSPSRRSFKYYWQRSKYLWASGRLLIAVLNRIAGAWNYLWKTAGDDMHSGRRRYQLMLNAHLRAQRSYRSSSYSGRTLLIQSDENFQIDEIRERWAELATGDFKQVVIPGTTHVDLLFDGVMTPTLAHVLRESLDSALAESTPTEGDGVSFLNPAVDTGRFVAMRAA